jgi:hypothetical protein
VAEGRVSRDERHRRSSVVIDSSVSPTYGAQEGTAYNGHFSP